MISCIDCGGINVIGTYWEDNDGEWELHHEYVNDDTALGELDDYTEFQCEDCGAEWTPLDSDNDD